MYGYDIGSQNGDDGWKFEEYDPAAYSVKWPAWVVLDSEDDDDPDDFISQAKDRLLSALAGFTPRTDYENPWPDDYYKQEHAAEKRLGLDFELYGVSDYVEWVLGFELARESGGIGALDQAFIATLLNPLNMADMDYRLREALRVLQLTPRGQPAPRLLLLASYF